MPMPDEMLSPGPTAGTLIPNARSAFLPAVGTLTDPEPLPCVTTVTHVTHESGCEREPVADGFPIGSLPPLLQVMVRATAQQTGAPDTLAACCALGVVSASMGAGLAIESRPRRVTPGNLYLLAFVDSGVGKTLTLEEIARPMWDFEADQVERWEREILPRRLAERELAAGELRVLRQSVRKVTSTVEREALCLQIQARLTALDGLSLAAPVILCEDSTTEKLEDLLSRNREVLFSVSGDAGKVLQTLLGRYHRRGFPGDHTYLKAYSLERCRVDRLTRTRVALNHPSLTVLWLSQPDKIGSVYGNRSLWQGGLLGRIMPSVTRGVASRFDRRQAGVPAGVLEGWRALVFDLLKAYHQRGWPPQLLHPTHEAIALLDAHFNELVDRRNTDLRAVDPFAARWNEWAWRLCVVLHAGKHGASAHRHEVEAQTARSAISVASYFAEQQLTILAQFADVAKRTDEERVLDWLACHAGEGITARDVQRTRITRTAAEARALLRQMQAGGLVSVSSRRPERGGHAAVTYLARSRNGSNPGPKTGQASREAAAPAV
jgi:hypothetical protein